MSPKIRTSPDSTVPLRTVCDDPHLDLRPVPDTLRPGALDSPVRWAHVSELPAPAPYLLGGELLLTAGVHLPTDLDGYVRGLLDAGVTALGFGLTPPLHDELPTALRDACTHHALPLLTVPTSTPFLAVSRAVALALDDIRHREQRRLTDAREDLTRAATRGLDTLTRDLAHHLEAWVALVDTDDHAVAAHRMPRPLPVEARRLLHKLRRGSGIRAAGTELGTGEHFVAQPVSPQSTASHLLAVGRPRPFDGSDRAIIAVGAALLGLTARTGATTDALGAATTNLVLGTTAASTALADLLGPGPYRVVATTAHRDRPDQHATADWLRAHLRTPLIQLTDRTFTAITRAAPGGAELDELLAHGWLTVVSSPTAAEHLPAAAQETRSLLPRARALGTPLTAARAHPLADLVPHGTGTAFAERTLAPLTELDQQRDNDLVNTLRTWLAHHGGWEATAAALGVHRNSVRHRIAQVEHALGSDLGDPETRMELWFALRWRP